MKTPDPSSEAYRAGGRSEIALAEPGPRHSEERTELEFEPKYLSIPQRRSRGQGRRNLVAGVALLFLSALLFGWALYLAGPGAVYTVAGALVTGATLYVLARARLLRQRNGLFLAGAVVCLLGVFLVLVQQAWLVVSRSGAPVTTVPLAAAPAVAAKAPAATPLPMPALLDTFKPSPAELQSGSVAKVLRGINVEVDRKLYRLRAGDLLPVAGVGRDEVRLAAGSQEVAVPASAVDVMDTRENEPARAAQPPETARESPGREAEEITKRSQLEATKKYPGLARSGSPENLAFVDAYREMKYAGNPGFFDNPEWPMRLADQLATREGWGQPRTAPPREEAPSAPETARPESEDAVPAPEAQVNPPPVAPNFPERHEGARPRSPRGEDAPLPER